MKKSKSLEIRVSEEELAAWKADAKKNGLTLADYARRRISLRPLKAKKRKYAEVLAEKEAAQEATTERYRTASPEDDEPVCDHGFSAYEFCRVCDAEEIAEDAREQAREAAWQARLESERLRSLESNRRWKANGLAYAAGGATRWFASMTPEQHAEWDDLRDDMLRCERNQ